MKEDALKTAYQAILQVNMLAGPHSLITQESSRLKRILEITDKALQTLNSEHTSRIRKAVFS